MPRGGLRSVRTNSENKAVSGPGSLSERTDMDPMKSGQVPQSQIPSVPVLKAPVAPPAQPTMSGLFDPTGRPEEPMTAGMPFGAGSNIPTVMPVQTDDIAAQIRAAYSLYPNPSLLVLLNALENEGR